MDRGFRVSERNRTENKELRPLVERVKEAEEEGKSELQKAQERIAALEAEKQESILAAARVAPLPGGRGILCLCGTFSPMHFHDNRD